MVALRNQYVRQTRADSDWRAMNAPPTKSTTKHNKSFAGFIFVCTDSTIKDLSRMVFGLPANYTDTVRMIRRGMPLFLFNHSERLLYGVFEATSDGGFNLDPYAWENVDSRLGRYSKPMSKFPAQVRIRIRDERPALDEDSFRSILDYEHHRFKFELNAWQVQQLLQLFDASDISERELERNIGTQSCREFHSRDQELTRSAYKSDSDCYSDCSSKDVHSGEDEWNDETVNDEMCYRQKGDGNVLDERLNQMIIDESDFYSGDFQISHASDDSQRTCYQKGQGNVHSQKIDYDNPMLRLHDDDPAVNSSSYLQSRVVQSLTESGQMVPSQIPFSMENVIFVPRQTVQGQNHEAATFLSHSHKAKWNDGKCSRDSSGHSRKQGFGSYKISRPKNCDVMRQHLPTGNEQAAHVHSQIFPMQMIPVCTQGLRHMQGPNHFPSPLPHSFMPQSAEGFTFMHLPTGSTLDESVQGFKVPSDVHIPPEEFQYLLQTGRVVYMPSVIPRPPPCPPPESRGFVEDLHYEILNFARWTRPSSEIQSHVEAAIDCVRKGVRTLWPKADVEVFGSFATGLCLQHSDVDLAVTNAPQEQSLEQSSEKVTITQASARLIRKLAAALREYEWCESINPLDTASMPVLKCLCRPFASATNTQMMAPIAVDITIGGMMNNDFSRSSVPQDSNAMRQVPWQGKFSSRHTGGAAREYVLHKIRELPALAPLVLLLKSYLHHKKLSNVYSGGLGSFSLTLLVAFYLERIPVPRDCLPDVANSDLPMSLFTSSPLSSSSEFSDDSDTPSTSCSSGSMRSINSLGGRYVRRAADAIEKVLLLWGGCGSPCLGNLLLGFLHTFGFAHDLSREKIILKGINGSPGGIFEREDRHIALWIDDPLRPGVNVGAGSYAMVHVQNAFKKMIQVLTRHPAYVPHLECEDEHCQDLAAIARLPHLSQLIVEGDKY